MKGVWNDCYTGTTHASHRRCDAGTGEVAAEGAVGGGDGTSWIVKLPVGIGTGICPRDAKFSIYLHLRHALLVSRRGNGCNGSTGAGDFTHYVVTVIQQRRCTVGQT